MDGRIFDLQKDLHADLNHDWTVENMAKKTGLSLSHFPSVFKSNIGHSPAVYLKKIRLERAKHLLETTHEHVRQIASVVGMPNESHFTRDYKIRFGLTPTEDRRIFNEKLQADLLIGQES
jgi:transcriptional regulator GlxA family with amidase domain